MLDLKFIYNALAQLLPHTVAKPSLKQNISIKGIKIDSRHIEPGDLFVALTGSRQNGHDYIPQAIAQGAVAALVSQTVDAEGIAIIEVDDTIKALGYLSSQWRDQFDISVVGITGSCGKTSVKQMVAAILQVHCTQSLSQRSAQQSASPSIQPPCSSACYMSPGNYNSITGVPLSLLQLTEQYQYAVLELGMNRFGEIATTSAYAKPDVVAINSIAPVHTEYVGDLAGVAKAKSEILKGLSEHGTAVFDVNSPFLSQWRSQLLPRQKPLTFGESDAADVQLLAIDERFNNCDITLKINHKLLIIKLLVAGKYNAMNAACAAAITAALGVDQSSIEQALASFQSSQRRFQRLNGINHSTIIDDSYNANPVAVKASIDVLRHFDGKKMLLLGSMFELGQHERQYHAEIGHYAKAQGIDYLFAVGELAREAADAYGEGGKFFDDREQLIEYLKSILDSQCCLLVKGSNSMNMRQFVLALSNA